MFSYADSVRWLRNNIKLKSQSEWGSIKNILPPEIPHTPDRYYANSGWVNWESFLNINEESNQYLPYKDAQKWVEDTLLLCQPSEEQWHTYISKGIEGWVKLPTNIPDNPELIYGHTGWVSWFRWFGKQNYNAKLYPTSYHECAIWVKNNLSIVTTQESWIDFVEGKYNIKRPSYIPPNPDKIYARLGWHGWHSFLGNNGRNNKYIGLLFSTNQIRINYNGEKLWVQPICIEGNTITVKCISMFSIIEMGSIFKISPNNIIKTRADKSLSKSKSELTTKFKLAI